MQSLKSVCLLTVKDLKIEFRSKEMLISLCTLSLILSILFSLGAQEAFLDEKTITRLFPVFLWTSFVCAGTMSIGRSFEYEFEDGALDGLLLSKIPTSSLFISKWLSNLLITLLNAFILELLYCIFLDIDPTRIFPEIILPTFLVATGYSALATILAALTHYARVKNLLLPLILLPLLFPIFFGALETTYEILFDRWSLWSPWITLLFLLDIVYVLAGCFLFEYVVKE